jgi:hypothetical protein
VLITGTAVGVIHAGIFSAPVTGSGSCTITVNSSPAATYFDIMLEEYSGTDVTGSRLEAQNTGSSTTGAPATGSASSAGEAVFVGVVATDATTSTTHTAGTGYTDIAEEENGNLHQTGNAADQIVAGATTDTADWTAPTTRQWCASLAVYKTAAGVPGVSNMGPADDLAPNVWPGCQ